jgi:arylsulfatase A-like enzyme
MMLSGTPRPRLAPVVSLIALAAGVLTGSSCRRVPDAREMNVLLVTIDTLRHDHCTVAGYARDTTPTLEALARQGTRMELAYAPTATTGPTHASIFTSLYPIAHGVVKNGLSLDEKYLTLAEVLRAAGYETAAVVSSFVLDEKFGYGQGFEIYEDEFDAATATIDRTRLEDVVVDGAFDRPADGTTEIAGRLLTRLVRGDRPFFLWVHYFDPHAPFVPPEPFASRYAPDSTAEAELAEAISAYDGEIAFADRQLGALLESLDRSGAESDTLVIVTADHGEGLMQHGHMHHGVQIYEEAVRVPLLFRLPGRVPVGRIVAEPVELVDVMPTVLDLVGVEGSRPLQGHSLAGAIAGEVRLDPRRPVYMHRRHYKPARLGDIDVAGEKFGIRVGPWKYIEGDEEGTKELFHLEDDPEERVNLYESSPAVANELHEKLAAWKTACGRASGDTPDLSPEDLERLRALGYVE